MTQYHYCKGGKGFILYRGREVVRETATMLELLTYMKANGIRDVEYRRPEAI